MTEVPSCHGIWSTAPPSCWGRSPTSTRRSRSSSSRSSVVLLVVILVLYRRERGRAKAVAGQSARQSHDCRPPEGDAASPGDGVPAQTPLLRRARPIRPAFGAASAGQRLRPAGAPAPPASDDPPPGTPAGWLPEPSGAAGHPAVLGRHRLDPARRPAHVHLIGQAPVRPAVPQGSPRGAGPVSPRRRSADDSRPGRQGHRHRAGRLGRRAGVVAGPGERRRLHVGQPQRRPARPRRSNSSGSHHRATGRWAALGPQVLADGGDGDADRPAGRPASRPPRPRALAEPDHEPRLDRRGRRRPPGPARPGCGRSRPTAAPPAADGPPSRCCG